LSERVDLSVDVHGARFTWKNGGGYFRELGSDPRTSGKYARTGFEYNFYHSFFWFADFAHSFQNSNTPQLLSGTLNLVSFGLRWRPPVAVGR
jgi:hemolysin activation/secretion protein